MWGQARRTPQQWLGVPGRGRQWLLGTGLGMLVATAVGWAALDQLNRRLGWPIVLAGLAAGGALLAPLLTEALKQGWGARAAHARLLAAHCWGVTPGGRLPSVAEATDPVELGVHPAAPTPHQRASQQDADLPGGKVPTYVPRDVDPELDAALRNGGLVVLVGRSTAGKSRTAYEAMRRVFPERALLVPAGRESLRHLLDARITPEDAVVWLNDLERHLGAGGLDVALLRRLLGDGQQRVCVLATMRASQYAHRSPDCAHDPGGPERDLLRAQRELLDLATRIDLELRFSPAEQERARQRAADPRLAQALLLVAANKDLGVAEHLAAGRRLETRWRDGQAANNQPVGAALVAAAVDCRRAGVNEPVPAELLCTLTRDYLGAQADQLLTPESFAAGLAWATTPLFETTALLTTRDGGYLAADYLLDAVDHDPDAPPVPRQTWTQLVQAVTPETALDLGVQAHDADLPEIAERAWRVAATSTTAYTAGAAAFNLGVMLADQGNKQEAESWFRSAAEVGDPHAANNLGLLVEDRGELQEAERWYRVAVDAGLTSGMKNLGILLGRRGDLQEAERLLCGVLEAGEPEGAFNLGVMLAERGELEDAEDWLRIALEAGYTTAAVNLGVVLELRGKLREAEDCYRAAVDAGLADAAVNLGLLLLQRGKLEAAECCLRSAAEAGSAPAANNLGFLLELRGELEEAEGWLRAAAEAGDPAAASNLGVLLVANGALEEAVQWLRAAADTGDPCAEANLARSLQHRGQGGVSG